MSPAERYEHMLSVVEAQICAEAFKVSQYEVTDPETAAEAKARWDDWAALYDALSEGLLDDLKADFAKRCALIGGAA